MNVGDQSPQTTGATTEFEEYGIDFGKGPAGKLGLKGFDSYSASGSGFGIGAGPGVGLSAGVIGATHKYRMLAELVSIASLIACDMFEDEDEKANYLLSQSIRLVIAGVFAIASLALLANFFHDYEFFGYLFTSVWLAFLVWVLRIFYIKYFK